MADPSNLIVDFGPVAAWSAWRWFRVVLAITAGWLSAAALVDVGRWVARECWRWLRIDAEVRSIVDPWDREHARWRRIRAERDMERSRG